MDAADEIQSTKPASGRLLSIDALRGFDMSIIMGVEVVIQRWAQWVDWQRWGHPDLGRRIQDQFEHVEWEGFRFYDLIFPLFLFIVGVVLPFSLGKIRDEGRPKGALYWRILRRTVFLFALGLIYNNILNFDWPNLRVAGVLQRIAICYGIAAVITVNTRSLGQAFITAVLLGGYWAILAFVTVPGGSPGDFTKEGNLSGFIDRNYLPGKIYQSYYGYGDNEGLLSTIPSVATVLLGVLAGEWLRGKRSGWLKVIGLLIAAALALAAGWYWSGGYFWGYEIPEKYRFPIIKNIWTSSFALYAGGWSFLLLGLFYLVIDVLKLRAWAFFFVVIGANAITIYIAPHFINFEYTTKQLLAGVAGLAVVGTFAPVLLALGVVMVKWLFLLFLYRHKIFLRV
jgi:predicted acyltransferase